MWDTECLIIHGTNTSVNNFIAINIVIFFVSDFKIVYYNNN